MSFKCGIVGMPNVGKSTLFNALTTSKKAQAENFPFCTIDPNIGIVSVPDERLNNISTISKSDRNLLTCPVVVIVLFVAFKIFINGNGVFILCLGKKQVKLFKKTRN